MSLRALVIGDIHGEISRVKTIIENTDMLSIDALILVGDIGPNWLTSNLEDKWTSNKKNECWRTKRYEETLVELLAMLTDEIGDSKPIYYVHGNHDYSQLDLIFHHLMRDEPLLQESKLRLINLHLQIHELNGIKLSGKGGAPIAVAMPSGFNDNIYWDSSAWKLLDDADVFVSHCPPQGILDGKNYGSKMFDQALYRVASKPKLVIVGHIHESAGVAFDESLMFLNAGALAEPSPRLLQNIIMLDKTGPSISIKELFLDENND